WRGETHGLAVAGTGRLAVVAVGGRLLAQADVDGHVAGAAVGHDAEHRTGLGLEAVQHFAAGARQARDRDLVGQRDGIGLLGTTLFRFRIAWLLGVAIAPLLELRRGGVVRQAGQHGGLLLVRDHAAVGKRVRVAADLVAVGADVGRAARERLRAGVDVR